MASGLRSSGLLFFQETYSTTDCEKRWKDDFEGNLPFSHGLSNSCGFLIAFYGTQDIELSKTYPIKKDESLF